MNIIRPTTITDAMLISSTVAEPDTGEVAWSATTIYATGDTAYLGSPSATVTMTIASPGVISWATHGLVADTPVVFTTTGTLPTGITSGTTYYVKTVLTSGTFTVAATIGGRAINTSGSQSGTHTGTAKVHRIYEALIGSKSTITMTIASPAVVSWTAHGLVAGTAIVFTTTIALPTGVTAGTTYYVITAGLTGNAFEFSATSGGSAVNTSGSQSGVHTGGLASTYNKPPLQNTTVWLDTAPTNRWAMLDEQIGTSTVADTSLTVVVGPGRFNSLALLEVDASTVDVRLEIARAVVTITIASPAVITYNEHGFVADTPVVFVTTGALPTGIVSGTTYYVLAAGLATNTFEIGATAGGAAINTTGGQSGVHTCGEVIYDYSMNLVSGANVGNWYQYFYEPVYQTSIVTLTEMVDAALIDLPAYGDGVVTLTLTRNGGTVSLGVMVVGLSFDLGTTVGEPEVSIIDYSTKSTDTFGNPIIVTRAFSKRMVADCLVDDVNFDSVANVLSTYRTTALVWIGSTIYGSLVIYGYYKDWKMPKKQTTSVLNVQVEGLSQ